MTEVLRLDLVQIAFSGTVKDYIGKEVHLYLAWLATSHRFIPIGKRIKADKKEEKVKERRVRKEEKERGEEKKKEKRIGRERMKESNRKGRKAKKERIKERKKDKEEGRKEGKM